VNRVLVRRKLRRYSREVRRYEVIGTEYDGQGRPHSVVMFDGPPAHLLTDPEFQPEPSVIPLDEDGNRMTEPLGDRGNEPVLGWKFKPRREEWWDVAVVPLLPGAADLTTEQREMSELLTGERNYGRASRNPDDARIWKDRHEPQDDASGSLDSLLRGEDPDLAERRTRAKAQRHRFSNLDHESIYEKLARGGDVQGWHVAWREPTGFPMGRPRLRFTPVHHDAARHAVGFSCAMFDVVAKRRTRAPLTVAERAERARLARAVAAYLDAGRRQDGRMRLLEEAYGTSRAMLVNLRAEGRLHKPT
jgi:hypothetical protein